jgi:hypothetical protein
MTCSNSLILSRVLIDQMVPFDRDALFAGRFFVAGSMAPQAHPEPYPRRTPKHEIEAEEKAQDYETIRWPARDDQYSNQRR